MVLNKPAGLPVHPGPRGGTSVEDCFPLLGRRRDGPWLAHRLDADTAGCLLVALRKTPLLDAQRCFATGTATKIYWAVVRGHPITQAGEIDQPIARQDDRNGWRMRPSPAGQPARTRWRVMGRGVDAAGPLSWLELQLLTGRTHQARLHCAFIGHPVLGDPVYGDERSGTLLHLLARHLGMPLDPPVAAVAAPPAHMRDALSFCGFEG